MVAFNSPEEAPTELGRLLLTTVPENEFGRKTLTHLASLIPMTRMGVTKWVSQQRVPADKVDRLVEIGQMDSGGNLCEQGRVSRADFEPFVYNFPSGYNPRK